MRPSFASLVTLTFLLQVLVVSGWALASEAQEKTRLWRVAKDAEYGYKMEKPIKVGGGVMNGPERQRSYLEALLGPKGESVSYSRIGSCCGFDRKNMKPLDMYEIHYEGLGEPIVLYLDSYAKGPLLIPVGLSSSDDKRRAKATEP